MGWTFYPIETLPEPGDLVWCKYPTRERRGLPGPVCRPVLVLEARVLEADGVKYGAVRVSYGSGTVEKAREGDFVIDTMAKAREVGLHKPTRFEVAHYRFLIWCEEFFIGQEYLKDSRVKIGRLDAEQLDALKALIG